MVQVRGAGGVTAAAGCDAGTAAAFAAGGGSGFPFKLVPAACCWLLPGLVAAGVAATADVAAAAAGATGGALGGVDVPPRTCGSAGGTAGAVGPPKEGAAEDALGSARGAALLAVATGGILSSAPTADGCGLLGETVAADGESCSSSKLPSADLLEM